MKRKSHDQTDSPVGAPDFEALFMAEMQARRERLAHWLQLIQEEVRVNGGAVRVLPRPSHNCRSTSRRARARTH
jgi:hypothetical protein